MARLRDRAEGQPANELSWAAQPAISTGRETKVAAAQSRARNRPSLVMNPTRNTGAVAERTAVGLTANAEG